MQRIGSYGHFSAQFLSLEQHKGPPNTLAPVVLKEDALWEATAISTVTVETGLGTGRGSVRPFADKTRARVGGGVAVLKSLPFSLII